MTDRAISLTGADGSSWNLNTGPSLFIADDQPLFGLPPIALGTRTALLAPGSLITGVQHSSRDLVLPLNLVASTPTVADTALRAFAKALDPLTGDVTVIVTDSAGNSRQIVGTYRAGWESIELAWCRAAETGGKIVLLCAIPYWRNTVDDSTTFGPTFTGTPTPFDDAATTFDKAWPFDGQGNSQFVFNLNNVGDVDAWPVFTVVGPASIVRATTLPTGKSWRLNNLLAGETLVINTDPRGAQVTVNGANAYGRLESSPVLWTLPPGTTQAALQLAGGSGASSFTMTWRPQYLTP